MLSELTDDERASLLRQLDDKLKAYCPGLTAEVGESTPSGRKLVFSAEGDTDLFRFVIDLVDSAPDVDWWEFVAFKQPLGKGLKVRFDKFLFDTRHMFFQQLECEEEPDMLGLRVAVPGNDPEDDDFQVGVYVTIEALIGEFVCATRLGYLETADLPKEPFKEGYKPLDDLPDFVEWFIQKSDA